MRKLLILLLVLPFLGFAQSEEEGRMMHVMEFTVKEGNQKDFMKGLEAWKKCYLDNGGDQTWSVWNRMNGEGSVVTLTFWEDNWAAMDEESNPEVQKNCDPMVYDQLMPYVSHSNRLITKHLPKWSSQNSAGGNVVWVYFFDVEDNASFNEVVTEVEAVLKTDDPKYNSSWFSVMGGKDGADYFVSDFYQNFAGMDEDGDNVWQIYSKAKGEEKMKQVREKFRKSLKDSWSYLYRYNESLSHSGN